jgi:beta-galactosidase
MERTATSARADARDEHNHAVREELPGLFQKMAGLKVKRFESLNNTKVGIRIGAIPAKGEVWADIVEPINAKPIAWYFDRKKHYSGAPAITEHPFGRGRVYYFGTSPGPLGIFLLFRRILKDAGLDPTFRGPGIEVLKRKGRDGRPNEIILNHTGRAWYVKGQRLEPYGVRILGVS